MDYTGKAVRIGFIHYNTPAEVDRLLARSSPPAIRSGAPLRSPRS